MAGDVKGKDLLRAECAQLRAVLTSLEWPGFAVADVAAAAALVAEVEARVQADEAGAAADAPWAIDEAVAAAWAALTEAAEAAAAACQRTPDALMDHLAAEAWGRPRGGSLIGQQVTIHGPVSAAQLNGQCGTVVSYVTKTQRYGVLLEGAEGPKAFRPANLLARGRTKHGVARA